MMKKHFPVFILYFAFLLFMGLIIRDIPGQPHLFSTINSFMSSPDTIRLNDPLSFSTGAIDIYQNGWFSPENQWLIRLWPPGFMMLEASILHLFGLDAPFIFILIVLSACLTSIMLLIFREYLLSYVSPSCSVLLPLLIFCFPVSRLFMLQPVGVILGENFSIIFFLSASLLCLLAYRKKSTLNVIIAGILFALSAYFRSQFEILISFLTIGSLPVIAWHSIKYLRWSSTEEREGSKLIIKILFTSLFVCHLLMAPWRINNFYDPYARGFNWVSTETITYKNAGYTTDELNKMGAGWISQGGGNMACILESSYCGQANKSFYYQAFFNNAGQWMINKAALVGEYWFSSLRNFTSPDSFSPPEHTSRPSDYIFNFLLMLCFISTWPLLWLVRQSRDRELLYWLSTSFYACFFVVFTFVQFEVRYFYLIKIFAVFTTITLGAIAWRLHSRP